MRVCGSGIGGEDSACLCRVLAESNNHYVGVSLFLYLSGKESPHKEILGWDPNRGISGRFFMFMCFLDLSICVCDICARADALATQMSHTPCS